MPDNRPIPTPSAAQAAASPPPRREACPADPCAMVIFGASGDLTKRLVIPALYNLLRSKVLPENFALIGVARTGETAVLCHVRGWMSARASATPTRWSLGIAARVEALESKGDAAEFSYRASIEHLKRTRLRVELGRSHLLYGEWLRRNGHRGKARHQLSIAVETLNEIGASGFAERAHRELAAATNRRMRRYADAPEIGIVRPIGETHDGRSVDRTETLVEKAL